MKTQSPRKRLRVKPDPVLKEANAIVVELCEDKVSVLTARLTRFVQRSDPRIVPALFDTLMRALRSSRSGAYGRQCVILSALDVCFRESSRFRSLCVGALNEIVDGVIGQKRQKKEVKRKLREMLHAWSEAYPKISRLRLALTSLLRMSDDVAHYSDFSRSCSRVQLEHTDTTIEQTNKNKKTLSATERQQRQTWHVSQLQLDRVSREYDEYRHAMESNLTEMDQLFQLLSAARNDAPLSQPLDTRKKEKKTLDAFASTYGLGHASYELHLQVPLSTGEIASQTSTKKLLLNNLLDGYRLIVRRHAPLLRDWLQTVSEADALSKKKTNSLDMKLRALRHRISAATLRCVAIGLSLDCNV